MAYPDKPTGDYSLRDYNFAQGDSKKTPMDEYLFKNGYKNADESEEESIPDSHEQNWLFDLFHRNLKYAIGVAEENKNTIEQGVVYSNGDQSISGTKTFTSTINGSISGNATTANSATKATQDANGNVITSTYATQTQLSSVQTKLQTNIDKKVSCSLSSKSNGYATFSNGLIIQWGRANANHGGVAKFSLAKAFTSTNYKVVCLNFNSNNSDRVLFKINEQDTTWFSAKAQEVEKGSGGTTTCQWIAIGY